MVKTRLFFIEFVAVLEVFDNSDIFLSVVNNIIYFIN